MTYPSWNFKNICTTLVNAKVNYTFVGKEPISSTLPNFLKLLNDLLTFIPSQFNTSPTCTHQTELKKTLF